MPDPISDGSANTGDQRPRSRSAQRVEAIQLALHRWLVDDSIAFLRVSLGGVFLFFGLLKLFPGISPAEDLVMTTTSILTFDVVPGSIAIVAIAVLECVIGLWLISGRALRGVIYLLAIELIGILAPVVLLGDRLFSGPHRAPTLQGQYVLVDMIVIAAVLVIATTVRGGWLTSRRRRPDTNRTRESVTEGERS
jgi:uncharacterized membrane protein YphA (DoxX/SURF4 family)